MRRVIPLIGPDFKRQSPLTFYNRVRSLFEKPAGSSSVEGIKISFGKKVTQVRVTRQERVVTHQEVELLAKEYDKTVEEISETLTKRKVQIK